ncbi:hypothetical protein CEXT_482571 [Caerostris extrusa]|uniref:Uncharacterized protein n=1 Tax=Caerostris extrusa TaxID=172846 RepID=A0AAV4R5T4_CAEEX|nr:hypothetical protein CEXT_482571 [Caerostris extrusa]
MSFPITLESHNGNIEVLAVVLTLLNTDEQLRETKKKIAKLLQRNKKIKPELKVVTLPIGTHLSWLSSMVRGRKGQSLESYATDLVQSERRDGGVRLLLFNLVFGTVTHLPMQ